jgi:DNA uptake protein ComE-like DNA-binding protein
MVKNLIRDYFTFSRKERNGMLVLIFIMTLMVVWPPVARLFQKEQAPDFTAFKKTIDSFQMRLQSQSERDTNVAMAYLSDRDKSAAYHEQSENKSSALFSFDPNTLDEDGWKKLGISERTIKTILNYRNRGGIFKKKEDLQKIYGLRANDFQRLEPFIQIPPPEIRSKPPVAYATPPAEAKIKSAVLELNGADSIQLTDLKGIGPVLASRILKFRNRLGGFYCMAQLKEVYGLSPETFEELQKQVSLDTVLIKKIDLNAVSINELKAHPYFKNPLAQTIISYREQHGDFNTAADMREIDLVTDEIYQKIVPYLEYKVDAPVQ